MPRVNLNNKIVQQLVRQAVQDVDLRADAEAHASEDQFIGKRYHDLADQLRNEESVSLHGVPLHIHVSTGFYA